ncbi:SNO glutamine amidotransferase [Methanococcus vannielii SB]|uniref:Pyridoxal 5'-phosphate synthase subunit PdxT n=1 Tax=Methanococcus vannielii (strain ATCC 35089 / DSM 1224 / JCM 13029 / OCM 148 / SB) TaxID=406327 RepID=PDXT_METVS|nr:pyridoxal 5'-phosphate synthase glutaminase subunit PdxT [Methanococcus vannielii]A6UQT7.1 RecName: Full=Pyridoxal 5'-phosphate synthase subunit PdxT; AltName: Full=Pdx2; AltName: Full=Pyridoxal 5'-phosphate synthase glutaminase subunit [Methanococcus vannielii SB]ABR54859.1 SNO glutamine amidotransferase [Methanococcus vannielii SB]
MKIIGILGIQGDIEEHEIAVKKINCIPKRIRSVSDLDEIDALIIPGGESTTIGKLMVKYGFIEKIRNLDIPILGTCAGMVLLSKGTGKEQPLLKILNVTIKRNAYGSQKDSFEKEIILDGKKLNAVFIRAPMVDKILEKTVEIISKDGESIVGVREGNIMAISFHPELSNDGIILYEYFLKNFVEKN